MHSVNGDGSKTAKIIKKVILPTITSPECQRNILRCTAGEADAPRSARVSDVTRRSAKISWTEPMSDGGSAVIGYLVEARTAYNPRWMKVTRAPVKGTEFTYTDPLEGDEYEFRVVAVNEAGSSKPSNTTPLTRIKDPFGQFL